MHIARNAGLAGLPPQGAPVVAVLARTQAVNKGVAAAKVAQTAAAAQAVKDAPEIAQLLVGKPKNFPPVPSNWGDPKSAIRASLFPRDYFIQSQAYVAKLLATKPTKAARTVRFAWMRAVMETINSALYAFNVNPRIATVAFRKATSVGPWRLVPEEIARVLAAHHKGQKILSASSGGSGVFGDFTLPPFFRDSGSTPNLDPYSWLHIVSCGVVEWKSGEPIPVTDFEKAVRSRPVDRMCYEDGRKEWIDTGCEGLKRPSFELIWSWNLWDAWATWFIGLGYDEVVRACVMQFAKAMFTDIEDPKHPGVMLKIHIPPTEYFRIQAEARAKARSIGATLQLEWLGTIAKLFISIFTVNVTGIISNAVGVASTTLGVGMNAYGPTATQSVEDVFIVVPTLWLRTGAKNSVYWFDESMFKTGMEYIAAQLNFLGHVQVVGDLDFGVPVEGIFSGANDHVKVLPTCAQWLTEAVEGHAFTLAQREEVAKVALEVLAVQKSAATVQDLWLAGQKVPAKLVALVKKYPKAWKLAVAQQLYVPPAAPSPGAQKNAAQKSARAVRDTAAADLAARQAAQKKAADAAHKAAVTRGQQVASDAGIIPIAQSKIPAGVVTPPPMLVVKSTPAPGVVKEHGPVQYAIGGVFVVLALYLVVRR